MKGPGFRYDVDIRRVWECPACGQRLRYLGNITSRRCHCDAAGHWMQIVDENLRRTFPEREKIVIPEEYPEETEPVTEEPAAEETPEQVNVESSVATEIEVPPQKSEANPPVETESPEANPAMIQSAPPETNPEAAPNRKKRRKKRRRKKSRNTPPESSGNQESQQNSPAPPPPSGENPNPGSPGEDFGTNV
jgi:hypothetical protein